MANEEENEGQGLRLRDPMELTLRLAGAGFKYGGLTGGLYSMLKTQPSPEQFFGAGLIYILGELLVTISDDQHHHRTGNLEKTAIEN